MSEFTDDAIAKAIQTGGPHEAACLQYLYQRELPRMLSYILKNRGDEEEGRDLFQDAMIVLIEQIRAGNFRREASVGTYLQGVGRRMWLNRLKRKGLAAKFVLVEPVSEIDLSHTPLEVMLEKERDQLFQKMMGELGEKCRQLLQLRLYLQLSMAKIAVQMGFKNEQNARNKHYKCKTELRNIILNNPLYRELIHRIPPAEAEKP